MGGSGNVHPQPKVYQLDLSMQAEVEERVQAMVERSSLLSQRLVSTGQVSSGLHSSLPVSFAPVPPPTYSQEASLLLVESLAMCYLSGLLATWPPYPASLAILCITSFP
ncbi:uncharacterized protein Gm57776 isoform X4 [Mus musculus]|uniref:uncharacterized protein Gm57776 isoform X4 n=1 Tax=Mus musculus TaxID=10090 RepID=UPI00167B7907|nr:uncharacterized protein LOC118567399 isoform X4 [Mus musculus]